jgi:hypothetical protein
MKALVMATLFAVLAVAALQLRALCDVPVANAPPAVEPQRSVAAAPAHVDVRPEIIAKVEQDRPRLTTSGDVDRYLQELESTARRKHQVTALEVEPGMQAIRDLQLEPDAMLRRQHDFAQHMATLSAELDHRDPNPPAPLAH